MMNIDALIKHRSKLAGMTTQELEDYRQEMFEEYQLFVKEWTEDCFPLDEFPYSYPELVINKRSTSTMGFYNHKHRYIEISDYVLLSGNEKEIKDTLKHEIIHYVCHVSGKQYRDGQKEFEDMLKAYEAPSNYDDFRTIEDILQKMHVYRCNCCIRLSARKYNNRRCSCKSKIDFVETTYTCVALYKHENPDVKVYEW
jgi:predicted SprT family Zn-dependent metalloprotease